jgi:hypothetical protein
MILWSVALESAIRKVQVNQEGLKLNGTHQVIVYGEDVKEPCVLYIGRAHRYPPNTPFYIFFHQIYVLDFLKMLHSPFFSLQNAVYFIKLPFLIPVLFAFYIQVVLKFKCQIPVSKG